MELCGPYLLCPEENIMVSEQLRNDVWLNWWDAARLSRYYDTVGDRFQRWHKALMLLILVCGTGSATYLLDLLPKDFQPYLGLALAVLSIWAMVGNYARKAAIAHAISIECSELEDKWRGLAEIIDSEDLDNSYVRSKVETLQSRIDLVSGRAQGAGIGTDTKLNEAKAGEARRVLESSYAAA